MLHFLSSLYLISVFVGQGVSYGKVYLFHIATILLIGFLAFQFKTLALIIKGNKNFYLVIASFYILVSLSYFLNRDEIKTFSPLIQYYVSFSVLALTPFAISSVGRDRAIKIGIYLISAHFALSLLESFNLFRWPISPYSPYYKLFLKDAKQDFNYSNIKNAIISPATSFFWNPNLAAYTTLLTLPLLGKLESKKLVLVLYSVMAWLIFTSDSSSLIVIFLISILLMISIKNLSRLTVLAFFFGILLIFLPVLNPLVSRINLSFQLVQSYIWSMVYLFKVTWGATPFNDLLVHERIRERIVLMHHGFNYLKENLLFGKGVGFLADKSFLYENRILKLDALHNFYLEMLIEFGLVGFFLFIIYSILFSYRLLRRPNSIDLMKIFLLIIIAMPLLGTGRYFLLMYGVLGSVFYFSEPHRAKEKNIL